MIELANRGRGQQGCHSPFPDFPGNARSFVNLDRTLLPYWHTLFDVCPGLLKLDPPDGLNIFRSFMKWAYRTHPPLNWSYYVNICRWLFTSSYQVRLQQEHLECFLAAAAAKWVTTDDSAACGIVIAWEGSPVPIFDWKSSGPSSAYAEGAFDVPLPMDWDFGWSPLTGKGVVDFRGWQPVTGYELIEQASTFKPRGRSSGSM